MIINGYIREEVGDRQEITSSMVARAERKVLKESWDSETERMAQRLLAKTQGQHLAQAQDMASGRYGLCSNILGYQMGSSLFSRCPYCGR